MDKIKKFNKKWFVEQYGKQPKGNVGYLRREYRLSMTKALQIEKQLQVIHTWELRYDAALKAWQEHERGL